MARLHAALRHLEESGTPWDMLLLSYALPWRKLRPLDTYAGLGRVNGSHTRSAYVVHPRYRSELLRTFARAGDGLRSGMSSVQPPRSIYRQWAGDQVWKLRQATGAWYGLHPRGGIQGPSYSNIKGRFVRYTV
mmetsp:Transcript_56050/g.128684  ORF Transcript_56050/g.128684 Transcript_56050/m.128684 type:complete len:133 (-) Transcript_56050:25-423(-)